MDARTEGQEGWIVGLATTRGWSLIRGQRRLCCEGSLMLSALLYSAVGAVFTWLLTIQWLKNELRRMERHYELSVGSWKDRYAAAFNRVQELENAIDDANYVRHWGRDEDASDAD